VNISAELEGIENKTIEAIMALQEENIQLSTIAPQNRIALDMLLASKGGVCTVINTSFCVSIDQSGRIATDLQDTWKHTKILHEIQKDDTSYGL